MMSKLSESNAASADNNAVAMGATASTSTGFDKGAAAGSAASPVRHNHLTYQHGHSFIKKTFHKPTNCHYCAELLWGLMGQGYICEGNSITYAHLSKDQRIKDQSVKLDIIWPFIADGNIVVFFMII